MRIKIKDLRLMIKQELRGINESFSARHIQFDPESGQIIDMNSGPVRGTDGAKDWDYKQMRTWMQDNGVETVTVPAGRGRQKEMTAKQFLAQVPKKGRVVPIVQGQPISADDHGFGDMNTQLSQTTQMPKRPDDQHQEPQRKLARV